METLKKKCIVCGFTKGLEIHHQNYDHNDNFPLNLEPVCKYCHSMAHKMGKDQFDRMTTRARVNSAYKAAIRKSAEEFYREHGVQ